MRKLTTFFIIVFIIDLALGSYFIIQQVQGKVIGVGSPPANLNFGNSLTTPNTRTINNIYPTPSADKDIVTKNYLINLDELYLPHPPTSTTFYNIDSWCAVQWFGWCSGGYPGHWCGDTTCDPVDETISNCPEDCEPKCGDTICDPLEECWQPYQCEPDCGYCPL